MILGIDLHGVIDSDIKSFKPFLKDIRLDEKYRVKIYIISGPPAADIEKELNKHGLFQGLHFNKVFSVVDFLKEKGVKMWTDERGRWWASEEDWWSSKAGICEKHGVDIMIDDKERYQQYFRHKKTKFLLYIK